MKVQPERSLAVVSPEVAAEWHPTKNGDLVPSEVAAQSNKKRWWLGKDCGHEWDAVVANRTRIRSGCAVCSGYKVVAGINDLATTHPEIAAEWHPTLNGEVKPSEVTFGSDVKHWWLGKDCGHSWQAVSYGRAKGYGCAVCDGKAVEVGVNDLASRNPGLAVLWHPTKNGGLTAEMVTYGSKKKVWWLSPSCGHEWDSMIVNQARFGDSCPFCSGARVLVGFNDLATLCPEIAQQWHPSKNADRLPTMFTIRSDEYAWWLGECGHSWRAVIKSRTRELASGCPQCWGNTFVSQVESGLASVVQVLLGDIAMETSVRSVVRGELDVFIPERNFAIEFNGLYWHTEPFKNAEAHALKSASCVDVGVHLVHVWEDDWRDRRDIVVRALAHRLGATERLNEPGVLLVPDESLTRRYGARTLVSEVLSSAESASFLEVNHIQGSSRGTLHTGLRDTTGILRAVFVAKRVGNTGHEGSWRIERYATRGIVPGGFTKLMKFTERQIREQDLGLLTQWVTFSDSALSDGGLYRNYGFTEDGFVPPDYQYVVRGERVHKFNYRLKRFKDDPELEYQEGLSERELALLNKIPRIWDSGKTRWVKEVK